MMSWSERLTDDIEVPRWLGWLLCIVPLAAFLVLL